MRTVVLARLRDPQAVDEVMQEISLALVRQQAKEQAERQPLLQDPGKLGPYLYQVAIRQALLFRRKLGRANNLTGRYAELVRPTEADAKVPEPLDWLLQAERRTAIRAALRRLPRRDAEILLLKYTESWSYRQIAQHLGLSESAVEARLHRARARMRRELSKSEVMSDADAKPSAVATPATSRRDAPETSRK